jgi:hypothetical protein
METKDLRLPHLRLPHLPLVGPPDMEDLRTRTRNPETLTLSSPHCSPADPHPATPNPNLTTVMPQVFN